MLYSPVCECGRLYATLFPSASSAPPAWSASSSSRCWRAIRGSVSPGSARASARKARRTATPRPGAWRRRCRTTSARSCVDAATPGRAPKLVFSGLDSSVAGEIEGAFAAAGHIVVSNARNYRMDATIPLLIPEINADHLALLDAPGRGDRLERPDRHQSELRGRRARDGARAAAHVWIEDGHRDDDAGDLGRRLSGRGVVGHSRQHHSVHRRRRRREDRNRDEEDPRLPERPAGRSPSRDDQRADDARRRAERAHDVGVGRLRASAVARRDHRRVARVQRTAAGARSAVGAAAADRVSDRAQSPAAGARRRSRTAA